MLKLKNSNLLEPASNFRLRTKINLLIPVHESLLIFVHMSVITLRYSA